MANALKVDEKLIRESADKFINAHSTVMGAYDRFLTNTRGEIKIGGGDFQEAKDLAATVKRARDSISEALMAISEGLNSLGGGMYKAVSILTDADTKNDGDAISALKNATSSTSAGQA